MRDTLMLTMFEEDEAVFAAMWAGARGYVSGIFAKLRVSDRAQAIIRA